MPFNFAPLRELLKCLKCGASLKQEDQQLVCENEECRQAYPVRDGIPLLLLEDEETSEQSSANH